MNKFARRIRASVSAAAFCVAAALPGYAYADPMRIAFGDIATVESLHLLVALERAKEKGVDIEVTYLKSEDIAAQAVVSGQADIGIGGPYALLQKVKAPIRIFMQLSKLQFYPVVNTEFYKDWKDLDGQEIAVHSRGSGTEAIMQLMADKNGIKYSNIAYVPGAEVRTGALLQGNVKATIVDSTGKRVLEDKAPGKFTFLPLGDVSATDEALFANTDYLAANPKDVEILVESDPHDLARGGRRSEVGRGAAREIQAAARCDAGNGCGYRAVFRRGCAEHPAERRRRGRGARRFRFLHDFRRADWEGRRT